MCNVHLKVIFSNTKTINKKLLTMLLSTFSILQVLFKDKEIIDSSAASVSKAIRYTLDTKMD